MEETLHLAYQTLTKVGEGVFRHTPDPTTEEGLARVRACMPDNAEQIIATLKKIDEPAELSGEGLRQWVENFSQLISRREFLELCNFFGLDPASFGELSEYFNILVNTPV